MASARLISLVSRCCTAWSALMAFHLQTGVQVIYTCQLLRPVYTGDVCASLSNDHVLKVSSIRLYSQIHKSGLYLTEVLRNDTDW